MEVEVDFAPQAVFLAGDWLKCSVTFKVPSGPQARGPPAFLAWSSVQLQCECLMEAATWPAGGGAGLHEVVKIQQNGRTSLRPSDWSEGRQIISSKPKVLFCELRLQPGESRSFAYSDQIPPEAPPTYRGRNIKFCYHLLIGAQRPNTPVQLVKVPVRVLASPNPGLAPAWIRPTPVKKDSVGLSSALAALSVGAELGLNPFLCPSPAQAAEDREAEGLGHAHYFHRQLAYFNISHAQGKIAELCLIKRDFKLGEEIIGTFNFSAGRVACLQYSAHLLCQEEIFAPPQGGAPSPVTPQTSDIPHGRFHEFCHGFAESGLSLEVPLNGTPTFSSNVCNIAWRIHFEFVLSTDEAVTAVPGGAEDVAEWNGPLQVHVQTLAWDLPIVIHPSEALQVELALRQRKKRHTFSI